MVKIKELPTEFKSAISIPQMYAINSNTASWNRSFYIGSLYQNVIFLINRVSKIWNNCKLVGGGGYLGDGVMGEFVLKIGESRMRMNLQGD